jgi:hypothetical protein
LCAQREAVKRWDVGTPQVLLTLGGADGGHSVGSSADGDVILVGAPRQAWCAASCEAIEKTETSYNRSKTR